VTIACPHCHFARSLPLEKVPRSIASATCPECNRSFMPQPQVTITCPHCHFSQELPLDKLPTKAVNATCPECRKQFPLPMRTSAP
ncbi:MAG TPA: hypothetical protein DEB35_09750, partial [Desulfuromonas sp.]|nr:hypothetical protein [Desulfuromonas sp.]